MTENRKTRMIGTCLCRRVTIEVPGPPAYIAICNCDLCRKSGHAIAQFPTDTVRISGPTQSYVREDMADTWITKHFCPTCGSATHSMGTPEHPSDVVRVNVRLFDPGVFTGTEARFLDGAAVKHEDDPFIVTATAEYGDGTTF